MLPGKLYSLSYVMESGLKKVHLIFPGYIKTITFVIQLKRPAGNRSMAGINLEMIFLH
jgi:hypothetical protein